MRGQREQRLGAVTPLAVTALAPGCTLSLLWEGAAECPVAISPASVVCSGPCDKDTPKGQFALKGSGS